MTKARKQVRLFLVYFLSLGTLSFAADDGKPEHKHPIDGRCQNHIRGSFEDFVGDDQKVGVTKLIMSGRDAPHETYFKKAIGEIYGEGGILEKLGISTPPHLIEMVPSGELMLLATLGRHPIPHWSDGKRIIHEKYGAAGVMEFVTPGCPTCHSMYTDNVHPHEQYSILAHVAGHNDFANLSMYTQVRNNDPIASSLKLHTVMKAAAQEHGWDTVEQWYSKLTTLNYMQDLARSTFEHPSEFGDEYRSSLLKEKQDRRAKGDNTSVASSEKTFLNDPAAPTQNILQYAVENLPKGIAQWKIDILEAFEETNRVYGAYSADKIINEGWATTLQLLVVEHSEDFIDDEHAYMYSYLMSRVVGPGGMQSMSNPYWLGREIWKIIRRDFNEAYNNENPECTKLERDRAFVDHAHEIIRSGNDVDVINTYLDEDFIQKYKLVLSRASMDDEIDQNVPTPPGYEQKKIVTVDPARVRRYLALTLADRRGASPSIKLKNARAFGRNVMEFEHVDYKGMPLKKDSMVQSMFVLSRIFEKPISLNTTYRDVIMQMPNWWKEYLEEARRTGMPIWWEPELEAVPVELEARFEVDSSGAVSMWAVDVSGEWREIDQHTNSQEFFGEDGVVPDLAKVVEDLQGWVEYYKFDQELSVGHEYSELERERFQPAPGMKIRNMKDSDIDRIIEHNDGRYLGGLSHTPTVPDSVSAYYRTLKRRMEKSLRMAAAGKTPVHMTKNGVRIRVMPLSPEFEYDRKLYQEHFEEVFRQRNPTPIDVLPMSAPGLSGDLDLDVVSLKELPKPPIVNAEGRPLAPKIEQGSRFENRLDDSDTGIISRPGKPGDTYIGPKPNGGGSEPKEPGEDPNDPDFMEIPNEIWQKYVLDGLELPDLEPKSGRAISDDSTLEGTVRRSHGHLRTEKMVPDAYTLGLMERKINNRRKKAALAAKKKEAQAQLEAKEITQDEFDEIMAQKVEYKPANRNELVRRGFGMMPEDMHRVMDRNPIESPDMNAVVYIIVDLSGSMSEQRVLTAKQAAYNMRLAMLAKYKTVEFRYITFDGEAHLFEDQDEFFANRLGGGTYYGSAFKKAKEDAIENYPKSNWDRYSLTMGDSGCFRPEESMKEFKQMVEEMKFNGYGGIDDDYPGSLYPLMQAFFNSNPKAGRETLVPSSNPQTYGRQILLDLFGGGKKAN